MTVSPAGRKSATWTRQRLFPWVHSPHLLVTHPKATNNCTTGLQIPDPEVREMRSLTARRLQERDHHLVHPALDGGTETRTRGPEDSGRPRLSTVRAIHATGCSQAFSKKDLTPCCSLGEPPARGAKPLGKDTFCVSPLTEPASSGRSHETESRMMLPGTGRRGAMGADGLWGQSFSLGR